MCGHAAALLIQGSAHVYSKKVEYLHQLVFQALDVIARQEVRDARPACMRPAQADTTTVTPLNLSFAASINVQYTQSDIYRPRR